MKVAVVGSGISGIASAWLLSQNHEVHLFESDQRLGGHAHTVTVQENSTPVPIDTGFLVYNELTYPHLTQFFRTLNVDTAPSDMSLSIQVPNKNLEWSGTDLSTVFAQRKNLLSLGFLRMLSDILRFGRNADKNLSLARRHGWTLGELLKNQKYSADFMCNYLLPAGAAIWSTPENHMLNFPAATFLTFFKNHRLLQINDRPQWRTVKNGSIQYIQKTVKDISHIHLSSPVHRVERIQNKVMLRLADSSLEFDAVVMATHAPITARILKLETPQEESVLKSFPYANNQAVLHTQDNLMPKNKKCWSSWNVTGTGDKISLNYYINKLQPLPTKTNYLVTLNPLQQIQDSLFSTHYAHPQFDQKAIHAQSLLPTIQGQGNVYFAGAWTRYGFHEDGILSAVHVAKLLGSSPPWTVL